MNTIEKFDRWTDERRSPVWLDAIRFAVGVYLFFKGYQFAQDFESLTRGITSMHMVFLTIHTSHYVVFAHLIGGLLIAIGAYTRVATALNIPILIGAVIFNYQIFPSVEDHMELNMAIAILLGLIAIFIYGGGRFSVDELRRRDLARKREAAMSEGHSYGDL